MSKYLQGSTQRLLGVIRGETGPDGGLTVEKVAPITPDEPKSPLPGIKRGTPPPASAAAQELSAGAISKPWFWQRKLIPQKLSIGVDIGPDALDVVAGQPMGDKLQLTMAESIPYPAGLSPEKPGQTEEFALFLRHALDERFGSTVRRTVWTSLPPSQVEVMTLAVPKAGPDELAGAVAWMARKERPFDEQNEVFDFVVQGPATGSGPEKLSVAAYHASQEVIQRRKKLFAKAGYPLDGIIAPCFLLPNLMQSCWLPQDDACVAFLVIDQDWTHIEIFADNRLLLFRTVKTGARSIFESVVHEYAPPQPLEQQDGPIILNLDAPAASISLEAAERLFLSAGGLAMPPGQNEPGAELSREQTLKLVQPALERLVRQVERTLSHSVSTAHNPPAEKVLLAGALTGHSALLGMLEDQLGLPVAPLDPLGHLGMDPEAKGQRRARRLALSKAAALAASNVKHTPNFLNTYKHKEEARKAARTNTLSAVAGLMLILAAVAGMFVVDLNLDSTAAREAQLQQRLTAAGPVVTDQGLNLRAAELQRRRSGLKSMGQRLVPVAALSDIWKTTPGTIKLYSVSLRGPASGDEPLGLSILVNGVVRGDSGTYETTLTSYLAALSGSPLVRAAMVENMTPLATAMGKTLQFTLRLELKE